MMLMLAFFLAVVLFVLVVMLPFTLCVMLESCFETLESESEIPPFRLQDRHAPPLF